MKAVILGKADTSSQTKWSPLKVQECDMPKSGAGESVVRIKAAALNHRDLFIRQGLYPGITEGAVMCADGVGVVEEGDKKGSRVILHPAKGWISDRKGPELIDGKVRYVIRGGTTFENGTLQEYMQTPNDLISPAPDHLTDLEAAALPLAGLTAFRALFTKASVQKGDNVLVTGIGGGVAIFILQFAVAAGVNVWVTSSQPEKIQSAIKLGARGGANYKEAGWVKKFDLPKERPFFDAVIDSSGGQILDEGAKLLRTGGIIVQYGQTTGKPGKYTMAHILKNIELRGSTMGSAQEFTEMLAFVNKHKIRPVVSRVFRGFDKVEEAFLFMKNGEQFGKIVIDLESHHDSKL